MKNILNEKGEMVAIDGVHEFELGWCYRMIKSYKQWYFKKNSKHPAVIRLRCVHTALDPIFFEYYLEISINNKLHEQTRIREEAYDVLARDKEIDTYSGIDFITLEKFTPNSNNSCNPCQNNS